MKSKKMEKIRIYYVLRSGKLNVQEEQDKIDSDERRFLERNELQGVHGKEGRRKGAAWKKGAWKTRGALLR